jgi:hypothetical protein
MKSSVRIASMTLFALSALLLSACASTTEAGISSADASGMEVNGSASSSSTTTTTTTEEQSDGSGTP